MVKKNRLNKTKKIEEEIKKKEVPKINIPHLNYIIVGLLLSIFALSIYLRAVMPYDSIFNSGIVKFASDDSVFQMRLVENTIANFPNRLTYDAFTFYPFGSTLHWGPLFTLIIATAAMIIGLGNPSPELVNMVGAFTPAIMGALITIPVYFIAKNLFNNRIIGLISALFAAILGGQYFNRSVLGFTDTHVAEILFTTLALACYIIALKYARYDVTASLKYSVLAGLMFASYLLCWTGAPFFIMVVLIFITIQSIIDVYQKKPIKYLINTTSPMFLIPLIFVLPFVNFDYGFSRDKYSMFHVTVLLLGIVLPFLLNKLSVTLGDKNKNYFSLSLIGIFVMFLLLIKSIVPQLYDSLINAPKLIFAFPTGGPSTVAEATSILQKPGMFAESFPILGFLNSDKLAMVFIVAVLGYMVYKFVKTKFPEMLLFIIWSIIMLLATLGQNRWAYYFAVNFAVIGGCFVGLLITMVINKIPSQNTVVKKSILVITAIAILTAFTYPTFISTYEISKYGGGDPSGGGYNEWYESLTWMRNNTPDTGVDYLGTYGSESTYKYPSTAYGVMSWWDYGHIITYYGHRIPIANPFQAGIGGGPDKLPGASMFLTSKSERDANKIIDELNAKYVISNGYMAYSIMQVFGIWADDTNYFTEVRTNKGDMTIPNDIYFKNMEAKLHIYDGNGLQHYRLIHESAVNPNTEGGHLEQQYKYISNTLYGTNIPIENSGLVKIFEYVPGAEISGIITPNTEIVISNNVITNIGRNITYSQKTISNEHGEFSFIVPYSTSGTGPTNFDTKTSGKYILSYGDITKEVEVKENEVLSGSVITSFK